MCAKCKHKIYPFRQTQPLAGKVWTKVADGLNRLTNHFWAHLVLDPIRLGGFLHANFLFVELHACYATGSLSIFVKPRSATKEAYLHHPCPPEDCCSNHQILCRAASIDRQEVQGLRCGLCSTTRSKSCPLLRSVQGGGLGHEEEDGFG